MMLRCHWWLSQQTILMPDPPSSTCSIVNVWPVAISRERKSLAESMVIDCMRMIQSTIACTQTIVLSLLCSLRSVFTCDTCHQWQKLTTVVWWWRWLLMVREQQTQTLRWTICFLGNIIMIATYPVSQLVRSWKDCHFLTRTQWHVSWRERETNIP